LTTRITFTFITAQIRRTDLDGYHGLRETVRPGYSPQESRRHYVSPKENHAEKENHAKTQYFGCIINHFAVALLSKLVSNYSLDDIDIQIHLWVNK
jgi:hypothetical protein